MQFTISYIRCFLMVRATQQALLTAPWPTELIGHHRSCIRTSTKTVDSAERAVHLAASEVLFRGLRVRMGIGTGIIEKIQVRWTDQTLRSSRLSISYATALCTLISGCHLHSFTLQVCSFGDQWGCLPRSGGPCMKLLTVGRAVLMLLDLCMQSRDCD